MKILKLLFLSKLLVYSTILFAQWSTDPAQNLKAIHYCIHSRIVTDGNGGAIVVGQIFTASPWLYAQRINRYGNILWDATLRGIRVSTAGNEQSLPIVVPDGQGGAYIGFNEMIIVGRYEEPPENMYFHRVRVQRIDANGNLLFGPEGLSVYYYPVDSTQHGQFLYSMISDNNDGAYLAWYDHNGHQGNDYYINHISAEGKVTWGNGIKLDLPTIIAERDLIMYEDGNHGVILYIMVYDWDHRFWRINSNGEVLINKKIETGLSCFYLTSTMNGECVFLWQDFNAYRKPDTVRCQKVNANGEKLWGLTPTIIDCTGIVSNVMYKGIAPDQKGGAYIAYYKGNDATRIIHLNKDTKILFKKTIMSFNGEHFSGQRCMVGDPNKLIYHTISGAFTDSISAYAIAVDSLGNELWSNVLFTSRKIEIMDDAVISDDNGGAIFCWWELLPIRGTWVQQVNKDGKLGIVTSIKPPDQHLSAPVSFKLLPAYPNPFNPITTIQYRLSQETAISIIIYNINGQVIRKLVNDEVRKAGEYRVQWNGKDSAGNAVFSGMYFYKLICNDFVDVKKMLLLR